MARVASKTTKKMLKGESGTKSEKKDKKRVRSAATRKLLRDVEGQDDSVKTSAKRKATLRRKKSQRG